MNEIITTNEKEGYLLHSSIPLKIKIPYLVFENERIKTPVGLSEILESAWTNEKDSTIEVVNKFNRSVSRTPDGRWVTIFERK